MKQHAVRGGECGLLTDAPPLSMMGALFLAPDPLAAVLQPQSEPRPGAGLPVLARPAEFHLDAMFAVSNVPREALVPQAAPAGAIELNPIANSKHAMGNSAPPLIISPLQAQGRSSLSKGLQRPLGTSTKVLTMQ